MNFKLFLIIILLVPLATFSEILNDVVLIGSKKTTTKAIIKHAQIKLNQELTPEELLTIKENILRINQIHLKKIEFNKGTLTIEIEDKWTLYPIPMITESGNYHNRGFLVYDDNFLGTLGTFAPGISWSNSVLNGLLYFQDESFFTPTTGFKILMMRKSDYVQFTRQGNDVYQYNSLYNTIMVLPNYLYKNHVFKAGPIYINKAITRNTDDTNLKDVTHGLFFRHHWNAYQTLDVMYEGMVTTYDLYILKSQNGKWINRHEGSIDTSIPYKRNFFNFGLHGHLVNDQTFFFPKILGGDEGYRGYDKSSLSASSNVGAVFQYQQHLFDKIFLAPFYEYNRSILISNVMNGITISESTVGLGLRYYFTKISIPAVIFDMARNIDDQSTHFHINIGVSL